MLTDSLANGLVNYAILLILLSFHEFGHAWMSLMCGDNTAKRLGRVSLNPLVHIDWIGTVALPLLLIVTQAGILFGWAKPVPFDPRNLKRPGVNSVMIAMAGPAMNLILAAIILPLVKVGEVTGWDGISFIAIQATQLSLLLCFFNLIPIPPLDGSHVLKFLTGMSDELFFNFARFGFIAVIVLLQFPWMQNLLLGTVIGVFRFFVRLYGLGD